MPYGGGAMLISAAFPSMTAAPSNKKRKIHKGRIPYGFCVFYKSVRF